ncbi:MAG: GbsR/MarR family transcriptional regulator [Myxococcota bacterium]
MKTDPVVLTPAQQRFVEQMGLHFASIGIPRIGGRIFGLMLIAPRPLRLEEIAKLLKVSRASVSVMTRLIMHIGVIEPHAVPGDRRNYYAFSSDAWGHRFETVINHAREVRKLAQEGLSVVGPKDHAARARLAEAAEFGDLLEEMATGALGRWRARKSA